MTFEQILTSLKQKQYKPIYFLAGEEPWYIDQITDYIADNVLSESEKAFNLTILYGKDITINDIVLSARRFPMMSPYQVVIVKEAQNIDNIEALEVYAQNPLNSTILVIAYKYKPLNKRYKLAKLIESKGILFETKKLYDNQLPTWITGYAKGKGKNIDPKASLLLSESVGSDLSKIANAIDKLVIALGPETPMITVEHVEKNIGISKEFNNFELQKAILTKNQFKANQIIFAFGKNPKDYPIQVTIATLFGFFTKLLMYHYLPDKSPGSVASSLKINPYFVQDYVSAARNYNGRKVVENISILREYDMKSKGFNSATTDTAELLKELIFKLMN
ncbi:DNA polymerase III delta subunit [Breznakibacter xylanolyticus]|uniref:DNA polymerase III subunit delta n=1 Tax=Breznakibacter xylanolyticus TaxID=990 RepID=A0A2W7NLD9_9BACT|nr:DNA polymerase III subunit delta [Breznakibacter xylanolyticus]PZX20700.1 DNA polymerase III delta subunit [Breznakibacter xylanolyticus]